MKINIMREAGYEEALFGLSLSFNAPFSRMHSVANRLSGKDGGHNKFLESIQVWFDIDAPLYWWKQFDTYRAGVTKQSESTMHTILKRPLESEDFEGYVDYNSIIAPLNDLIASKDFDAVNRLLPQSFLQRRIVCTNYKSLRNMFMQRGKHKLGEWRFFCDCLSDLEHHQLLTGNKDDK